MLEPYFHDFDKVKILFFGFCLISSQILGFGNVGRVTRAQFSRILSMVRLRLSEEDLHILCKKYEDRFEGRIMYLDFVKAVDPESKPIFGL